MSKRYALFLSLAFLLPVTTFAEPMVINCDHYLNDKNLTLEVAAVSKNTVKAGDVLNLNGAIINKNNFPIGDVGVYLKIVNKQSDENIKVDGLSVVDQYYPLRNSYLEESHNGMMSIRNFSTVWNVPKDLMPGEYGIVSYLVVDNKIVDDNFNGSNKVVSYFSVESNSTNTPPILDRSSVKLNDTKYSSSSVFSNDEPVKITFSLKNPSSDIIEGNVSFKTLIGEVFDDTKIAKNSVEYFKLNPNEVKEFSYVDYGSLKAKSKVLVEIFHGELKEILNVNYRRSGYDDVSILSSGLNKFPIKSGYTIPLYVCYKNQNDNIIDNANLKVEVVDEKGVLVYSGNEKIGLDNLIRGFVFPVKFNEDYREVKIRTSIEQDGVVFDSKEQVYNCNFSQDGKCNSNKRLIGNNAKNETPSEKIIIITITLLLFAATAIYLLRHKKSTSPL